MLSFKFRFYYLKLFLMLILKFFVIKISCNKINFILKERRLEKMQDLNFSENSLMIDIVLIDLGQFCSPILKRRSQLLFSKYRKV